MTTSDLKYNAADTGIKNLELVDGNSIPILGLGTYKMDDDQAREAVRYALEVGYRHIDTASLYRNEKGVGQGIADAIAADVVKREDVFVTTKVWNDAQEPDATRQSVRASLERLGLDYVDLVLVHWPVAKQGTFGQCFDTLLELKEEGLIRSVGVANFYPEVLDQLSGTPVVNQIELHPQFPQNEQVEDDRRRGIVTQAWSPLGRAKYFEGSPIADIAERLGKTPAQVAIRWHLQRGIVAIPKSATPSRIKANFEVTDFELTDADMDKIASMALDDGRMSGDPRVFGNE
ncbi:MAG: aldo/keto reductase [Corynebacterium sp.]|uniref:aldo/keto reductase n=1 Tax=Corynebacterium sp. TaxID=1720 RepID=UPI0026DCB7B4|nr:aldo/keto reductase [Corynebacterium sp.]MDO5030536.1 aldo/keto reductase [Corynebacterium sp.]